MIQKSKQLAIVTYSRYQNFKYTYWFYRFLAGLALLLLLFNVGGDTSSYKVFADLEKGFIFENILGRSYNRQNYLQPSTNTSSVIMRITNGVQQFGYIDNKGKSVENFAVSQDASLARLPQISFGSGSLQNSVVSSVVNINEIITPPLNPEYKNYLTFPAIKVNAPLVYSDINTVVDNIDKNNPCSASSIAQPFQQLVKKGLVHLWPSPKPGELWDPKINIDPRDNTAIGNSYIAGHSSECVSHEYSRILAPMQDKDLSGLPFYIYNEQGIKLTFVVFECKEVEAVNNESFKIFPSRRVVTLQTSKYYSNTKINRWICRGELDQSLLWQ
jgi:hypothetical protein